MFIIDDDLKTIDLVGKLENLSYKWCNYAMRPSENKPEYILFEGMKFFPANRIYNNDSVTYELMCANDSRIEITIKIKS